MTKVMGWNPYGVSSTLAMQGKSAGTAQRPLDDLLTQMESLTPGQRIDVFQVLTDFFCPRCGIEQPKGDCQCR